MKNFHHSGKVARNWRSALVDKELRLEKPVRTLQFPLSHEKLSDEFIQNAKNTFLAVRGVGDGSLTKMVQTMLLCGFRIVTNAENAKRISPTVQGAVAFQSETIYGGENQLKNAINSPNLMQACFSHLNALDDVYFKTYYKNKNNEEVEKILGIKERFVDGQSNGFANLFGKEKEVWKRENPEIAQYYKIPENKQYVIDIVKEKMNQIDKDEFYQKNNFSGVRKVLQGNIHGWVSNYDSRISVLKNVIDEINFDTIDLAPYENYIELFKGLPLDYSQIQNYKSIIANQQEQAKKDIDIIYGKQDGDVEQAIENIVAFNDSLSQIAGILRSLAENIEKFKKENKSLKINKLVLNGKLSKLDKIPKFTGSQLFEPEQISTLELELKNVLNLISTFFDLNKSSSVKAINCQLQIFKDRWGDKANGQDINQKFVIANVFHRFVVQIRKTDVDSCHQFIEYAHANRWVSNKKDLNKFLLNEQGHFWKSPYARNRHESYDSINHTMFGQKNIFDAISEYLQHLKTKVSSAKQYTNYLLLDYTYKNILLSTINDPVKKLNIKKPRDYNCDIVIDPIITLILGDNRTDSVAPDVVKRIFNTYGTKLKGLFFAINRTNFIDKITLRLAGDEFLYYAPKNQDWNIPKRIWLTDNSIRQALESLGYTKTEKAQGLASDVDLFTFTSRGEEPETSETLTLGVLEIFGKIMKIKNLEPMHYDLLKQLPHDWCYELPSYQANDSVFNTYTKVKAEKKKIKFSNVSHSKPNPHLMRLIGASSYKNILDNYLTKAEQGFSFGTAEVVLTLSYNQTVGYENDEIRLSVDESPQAKLSINLPVNEVFDNETVQFDKCVAIDLGEYGIGYAVFDIHTGDLITSGTKNIPAIRRVKTKATKYRNTQQKTSKFKTNFNDTMMRVRKNAVGDVRNYINTLMKEYNAFPVFEYSVGNFESGGNQLKVIYQSILNYYCFSSTDAHKNLRSGYWNIRKSKEIDLLVYKSVFNDSYTDIADKSKTEELKLHPGVQVSPAFTSQTCSNCNRCATLELKNKYNDMDKLIIDAGVVSLSSGKIKLYQRDESDAVLRKRIMQQSKEQKKGMDIKMRSEWTTPIPSDTVAVRELKGIIKRNIRRSPLYKQSKDTTQSRFFCPYVDCAYHQRTDDYSRINGVHADENAAVNIGRRFLLKIAKLNP